MKYSKLSDHTLKKGKFITPFNSLESIQELSDEKSWAYGRMPEYLWIGLILKRFGRENGLNKLNSIISKLHNLAPELSTARMSQILKLDTYIQEQFFDYVVTVCSKESLAPLTIFLTSTRASFFAKYFYCPELNVEDRCDTLIETMREIINRQSNESTDIQYVALWFNLLYFKEIHLQKHQYDLLIEYPKLTHTDERMVIARASVRLKEMTLSNLQNVDSDYLLGFWSCVSEMTECKMYSFVFPIEKRDVSIYMERLYEVFSYLSDLFITVDPLDEKMKVLLGISTYSYKRLKELYEHNLFNSISARSCVRVLIEDYIMMRYLVKNEASHDNIWRDYQFYGIGSYKLVLERYRESDISDDTHFDKNYVEALVNEYKSEEFIDMDTKYFDEQSIRFKAESVDEKSLYGLYYDYDTSFEHGFWGAIRESSLLKCNNPAHKYHCIPDVEDNNRLKTVLPDCIMIMNKTISFLNDLYGIPEQILNGVINFEIEPSAE
jgi:hypothetical protein